MVDGFAIDVTLDCLAMCKSKLMVNWLLPGGSIDARSQRVLQDCRVSEDVTMNEKNRGDFTYCESSTDVL